MPMLWQRLRKKWSVKMDKKQYVEVKNDKGNCIGWIDKRYSQTKTGIPLVSPIKTEKETEKSLEN